MPYVAFLDLVGTRAAALIGNSQYSSGINSFVNALTTVGKSFDCKIFGYSDNAYLQINDLKDIVPFFQTLRDILFDNHCYFSAAVVNGKLDSKSIPIYKNNHISGNIMCFTGPATVTAYLHQSQFCGIGVAIDQIVIDDIKKTGNTSSFCTTIFQEKAPNLMNGRFQGIYDIGYESVSFHRLSYVISDYIVTASLNEQAGRYYITPIISMLKCLDNNVLEKELTQLVSLISFKSLHPGFLSGEMHKTYVKFFVLALIDHILSLKSDEYFKLDTIVVCEKIICESKISIPDLLSILPITPLHVISAEHKNKLISIIYNMEMRIKDEK